MSKEELLKIVYEGIEDADKLGLWYCSIVWKDAFGMLEHKMAFFNNRYDAEQWFGYCMKKIQEWTNGSFYGFCCDKTFFKNAEQLLKDEIIVKGR